MRLHPNRRASTDHTPGPIIASAMLVLASRIFRQGSPDLTIKLHTAKAAIRHPETGVHKPANRRTPPITAAPSRAAGSIDCAARTPGSPNARATVPATRRKIRRPAPGQPWANVEKRRRKHSPAEDAGFRPEKVAPIGFLRHSFGELLEPGKKSQDSIIPRLIPMIAA
jgi:hypothetical protein